jgi:hypothetical protein
MAAWGDLFRLPDHTGGTSSAQIAADWYFAGRGAPAPIEIPYLWLSGLSWRSELPYTTAEISGPTSSASRYDQASRQRWGDRTLRVTLETACDADPTAITTWVMSYLANPGDAPRQRMVVRLRLGSRTTVEQWRILGVGEWQRITVTGAPSTWPSGATEQIIEGRRHMIDDHEHTVEWITSPVVGSTPGVAGPWFRVGVSAVDGSDAVPF